LGWKREGGGGAHLSLSQGQLGALFLNLWTVRIFFVTLPFLVALVSPLFFESFSQTVAVLVRLLLFSHVLVRLLR
jgi:hypothetical protein